MSNAEDFAHPEFLIETEALEHRLGDPALQILDCTTHLIPDPKVTYQVLPGRGDFEKGHIPGAQFVDLQGDLSDKDHRFRFMLPSAEAFAAAMSGFGVGEGTRVVLYSTANPWWATRVWWMLRVFRFDNARSSTGAGRNGAAKAGRSRPVRQNPAHRDILSCASNAR
jgi:thiosulfate/3-mercaptopyruvate sulfurtransferase